MNLQKKQFERKLYLFRTLEGERNRKALHLIRDIASQLGEGVIGIAPFGSITRGYNQKGSDFDLIFLIDKDSSIEIQDRAVKAIEKIVKELNESEVKVHLNVRAVSLYSIMLFIRNCFFVDEVWENTNIFNMLVNVCRMSTGDTIFCLRKTIAHSLCKFNKEDGLRLKRKISGYLMDEDGFGIPKMSSRCPEVVLEQYLQRRRKMWDKRIERCLGI